MTERSVPVQTPPGLATEHEAIMVADVGRLVRCESPSEDAEAVARSAEVVARMGAGYLGTEPERIVVGGCTHLRWRFGGSPRVLVLGHHDTVWPLGSIEQLPFRVDGGTMRGPGCFDMKAGLVVAFHALAALSAEGGSDRLDGVTLLITGDEEPGSQTSRALIEQEARGCAAALVLEGAGPGGALKTERKGVSRYQVHVRGRAAHSGLEPERGVNATVEAAHQVLAVAALGAPGRGTTVTPTRLESGTTSNTVPAEACFEVDVRVCDTDEQQRVDQALRHLTARLDGAEVVVAGGPNRPPLPPAASRRLFARARRLAAELGLGPLSEVAVGGASDGNFTAGVGTPTLDGLGAVGGGAHAVDEHVLVAELPRRTRLLTALLSELLTEGRAPAALRPPERTRFARTVPADDQSAGRGWNHDRRD